MDNILANNPNLVQQPSFTYTLQTGELYVNNQLVWNPKPSNQYKWDKQRIVEINLCHGEKDGSLVQADGASIHKYAQQFSLHSSSLIEPSVIDTLDSGAERLFYFECKNQTEDKLYYCPKGSVFTNSSCTPINICQTKGDGYKYDDENNKTCYFECENGQPVRKCCPANTIFKNGQCVAPIDECSLKPDNTIVGYGQDYFLICKQGATQKRYCNANEYYHVNKNVCAQKICQNKFNDKVPTADVVDKYWRYAKSYVQCIDGEVMDKVKCTLNESGIEYTKNSPELPLFQVADTTSGCAPPKLCENVRLNNAAVPGVKYRQFMNNYTHNHLFDHLYGYNCNNNTVNNVTLKPGEIIASDGSIKNICNDPTTTKFPIMNHFDQYYDCQTNTVAPCSFNTNTFDYGQQKCIETDDTFFKFENLPIFKFKELDSTNNWIAARPIRQPSQSVACGKGEKYDEMFNTCVDWNCAPMAFLSQLGEGRRIFKENGIMCVVTKDGHVKSEPYDKPDNTLQLDFWRQKFISGNPEPCKKSNRLQSLDALLNAVTNPTCTNVLYNEPPFIICPSTYTKYVHHTPTICHPEDSVLKSSILPANTTIRINSNEIDHILTKKDRTFLHVDNVLKYARNKNIVFPELKINKSFNLSVSEDVDIYKMVPTNHPHYFLGMKKGLVYAALDLVNHQNITIPVKNVHYEMQRYNDTIALTGFK